MDVVLSRNPDGVDVTVGGQVLHTAASVPEAQQLAQWVRYQLNEGRTLDDLACLLRGEAAASAGPDLALLDGSVSDVQSGLATGAHDAHLAELVDAETSGKARRGALAALRKRKRTMT